MADYYSILGIPRNASQDDVRKAYKKQSMLHHPDRGGNEEQFKKVNEAYQTLKDPQKRAMYDSPQPRMDSSAFHQNFGDFNDIFSQMFGHSNRHQRRQQVNPDITVAADIDLKDVFQGKNVIISYRLGSGRQETVTVDLPPGAKHGDAIRYEGLGDDIVKHLPRGNLIVKVRERRHSKWTRDGDHIHCTHKVNVFDLLLGCVIIVDIPNGKSVEMKIPKGTNPGQTMSISGYGIPNLRSGRRGNVYVKIQTDIPKIDDLQLLNKIKEIQNQTTNIS